MRLPISSASGRFFQYLTGIADFIIDTFNRAGLKMGFQGCDEDLSPLVHDLRECGAYKIAEDPGVREMAPYSWKRMSEVFAWANLL
jgi:hypothetical protein